MEPVYYCQRHETCTTERVDHRAEKIKVPMWETGDVNVDALREKDVAETTILDVLYQYNCVGVFEVC